ncbi:MAG TPA: lantibiotic dehydratase C-terminal domain-containing protein [Thermoanaerobaculia bacterium]|nr:lantibiotic dehydratase C-terminal domain-containing protein [Thermoanaerobaculia bacterium]
MSALYPDPLLSSSLYGTGRLDALIVEMVAPFWREVRDQAGDAYLWMLRYGRRGEHLKLRLHGPEDLRPLLAPQLEAAAESYFAARERRPRPAEPVKRRPAPPLDEEDHGRDDHPDDSFLWTRSRRVPMVLGAAPLLHDDRYAALFTTCLGRACELILDWLELEDGGTVSFRSRQGTLMMLLSTGLAAAFPDEEERVRYLTYHRDWLVRSPVLYTRGRIEKARAILDRFDQEAERMGSAAQVSLAEVVYADGDAEDDEPAEAAWRRSVAELRAYLEPLQGDPVYDLDPFVEGPLHPCLFKLFHCVANQIGLTALNEALTWHLLVHAADEESGEFRLVPAGV